MRKREGKKGYAKYVSPYTSVLAVVYLEYSRRFSGIHTSTTATKRRENLLGRRWLILMIEYITNIWNNDDSTPLCIHIHIDDLPHIQIMTNDPVLSYPLIYVMCISVHIFHMHTQKDNFGFFLQSVKKSQKISLMKKKSATNQLLLTNFSVM